MRALKWGVLVAAMAWAGLASAWWVDGTVVCQGTTQAVANVELSFTQGSFVYPAGPTDQFGWFTFHIEQDAGQIGMWDVALTYGGVTVQGAPVFIDGPPAYGVPFTLAPIEVDASLVPECGGEPPPPPPPPPKAADCSPGYYKNHPAAWCGPCDFSAEKCSALLQGLTTRGSSGAREAAKAEIDACFGTAAASPCLDDD